MKEDEVMVHVQENLMSDGIWVLIPPRYWGEPKLSEGIRNAVEVALKLNRSSEDKKEALGRN